MKPRLSQANKPKKKRRSPGLGQRTPEGTIDRLIGGKTGQVAEWVPMGLGVAAAAPHGPGAATAAGAIITYLTRQLRDAHRKSAIKRALKILDKCETKTRREKYKKMILKIRPDLEGYI